MRGLTLGVVKNRDELKSTTANSTHGRVSGYFKSCLQGPVSDSLSLGFAYTFIVRTSLIIIGDSCGISKASA